MSSETITKTIGKIYCNLDPLNIFSPSDQFIKDIKKLPLDKLQEKVLFHYRPLVNLNKIKNSFFIIINKNRLTNVSNYLNQSKRLDWSVLRDATLQYVEFYKDTEVEYFSLELCESSLDRTAHYDKSSFKEAAEEILIQLINNSLSLSVFPNVLQQVKYKFRIFNILSKDYPELTAIKYL